MDLGAADDRQRAVLGADQQADLGARQHDGVRTAVGGPLLVRTSRGTTLTEAGTVRLAAFPSAAATLVPPAVRSLRDGHAGVEVTLVETEPPEAWTAVLAGDIGIARVFGHEPRLLRESDDYVVVQNLVAHGLGVTVLPGLALTAFRHPEVEVRAATGFGERHVGLVHQPGAESVPAIRALMERLQTVAASVIDYPRSRIVR